MAEDVRELLPLPLEGNFEQHGRQTAVVPQHDLHLHGDVFLFPLVGEVNIHFFVQTVHTYLYNYIL